MRVVVTGSTGLIGSRLIAALSSGGHQVWAVSRTAAVLPPSVQAIIADLSVSSLPPELPDSVDAVVHLAQSTHYRDFPEHAMDVFNVNVASTARLLDWSRRAGVRQFVVASSGGVGSDASTYSHYIASKQCAELLAASYSAVFRVLVLRFFFVYGRGQKPGMLVPRLVETIHANGRIALDGVDGPRLNPVHVDDAANAMVRALQVNATGTIDIAGSEVLTVRAMSETIAAQMGRTVEFACDTKVAPRDLVGDISVMSSQLVPPQRSFSAGVAELIPSPLRA